MSATLLIHGLGPLCRDLEELVNDLRKDLRKLSRGSQPSEEDLRVSPLLDEWSFGFLPAPCLIGSLHQSWTLGARPHINTPELVLIDPHQRWARTWSRFYRLGKRMTPETATPKNSNLPISEKSRKPLQAAMN